MAPDTTTALTVKPDVYHTRHALSAIQFERTWKLAADHGHEWPYILAHEAVEDDSRPLPVPAPPALLRAWTDELIAAMSHAATLGRESGVVGIDAPTVVGGQVVHQTMTGRLTWAVDPDGATIIWVNRPKRRGVMAGFVRPDGSAKVVVYSQTDIHARHVVALCRAMAAIVGHEAARQATAAVWATALPDTD